ncbi:hypothetical protein DFP73DRAFT_555730, partial [Morchella snyderi]
RERLRGEISNYFWLSTCGYVLMRMLLSCLSVLYLTIPKGKDFLVILKPAPSIRNMLGLGWAIILWDLFMLMRVTTLAIASRLITRGASESEWNVETITESYLPVPACMANTLFRAAKLTP